MEAVPAFETVLLSGQLGPAYFLVPVLGDIALQDLELRRALAKTSLREGWHQAVAAGVDQVSEAEIDKEIDQVRAHRRRRQAG